ncbi:nucleotide-diphospho-sugar transferase [Kalaharituber pfeilii]|nr:nucleotide-diphospho-sugar transferase [Kalaharituber pfeilii]
MGFTVPSSVEDYLALGEAVYLLIHNNPSIFVTIVLASAIAALAAGYLLLLVVAHFPRAETSSEKTYLTISPSGEVTAPLPLPNTTDYLPTSAKSHDPSNPPVLISVIVPAYNESLRLPAMLAEAVDFLTAEYPASEDLSTPSGWEILIVDDGSTDDTSSAALSWIQSYQTAHHPPPPPSSLRVVTLSKNRGKGGAVTHGMRHCRGLYTIFADADGATRFSDLRDLLAKLMHLQTQPPPSPAAIAVGSRAHMVHTAAVVKRSFIRNLLMYSFHTYLGIMGISAIKDTQCGFKLFSREAAVAVFRGMYTEGWIFDVEILLRAERAGIRMVEVPVNWHEVEGTKMELVRDSVVMALDLLVLRAGYAVGIYKYGV